MILDISTVRAELGWNASRDAELERLITAVEDATATRLDRTITTVTDALETIELDSLSEQFRLRTYPLTAISIAEWPRDEIDAPDMDDPAVEKLVEGDDFVIYWQTGRVKLLSYPERRLRVKYSGGWSQLTFPPSLKEAMIQQIKFGVVRNKTENIAVASVGLEKSTTSFLSGPLHPLYSQAISQYRRLTF